MSNTNPTIADYEAAALRIFEINEMLEARRLKVREELRSGRTAAALSHTDASPTWNNVICGSSPCEPTMSDEAREALASATGTIRYDFFFRTEAKAMKEKEASFAAPAGLPLHEVLRRAYDAKVLNFGTHRSGCYQIQSDVGVYEQTEGRRIELATPRRAAKVTFKTWEELEAEEVA